jgi:hypothetical protein
MFLAGKLKPISANNGFAFGGPWRQRKETIGIKTIFEVHDRADCKVLKGFVSNCMVLSDHGSTAFYGFFSRVTPHKNPREYVINCKRTYESLFNFFIHQAD